MQRLGGPHLQRLQKGPPRAHRRPSYASALFHDFGGHEWLHHRPAVIEAPVVAEAEGDGGSAYRKASLQTKTSTSDPDARTASD